MAAAPLASAHVAPERSIAEGFSAANLTVEAALGASVLTGGSSLVTSGTLMQAGGGWTWTPEPSDRLVVRSGEGTYEIVVTQLQGDLSGTSAFFSGNHTLESTVRGKDAEVTIRSFRAGAGRQAGARGTITIDGVSYRFDLATDGTELFENDSTGSQYDQSHRLTGTVDWADAHLDVDESWEFHLVSSTGSRGATASSAVRTVSSRLQAGGAQYAWEGVLLTKAFRDGKPNEIDTFWGASGQVTRDGAPFGRYELDATLVTREAGFLKFLLHLPDQTIEVESWPVY